MPLKEYRYRAFISYRHLEPDQSTAKYLHTAIETYRCPADIRKKTGLKRLGRVFRDAEELPLSPNLGADILKALDESEWLIVICSPDYPNSRWCLREVEYFVSRRGYDHVLAVLSDGEPDESFPDILLYRPAEDGSLEAVEPLAADARGRTKRERRKKLKKEKLRLLAPIMGVTYDELNRREKKRAFKKRLTAAVSVLCALILAALVTLNVRARNEKLRLEAEEQKRIAEEERLSAVSGTIGMALENAGQAIMDGDRRAAVRTLLSTLDLSGENGGMRREEILRQLRRALYIRPFDVIALPAEQNLRLISLEASGDGKRAAGIVNGTAVCLMDPDREETLCTVKAGGDAIDDIALSPDGSKILGVCDWGRYLTVWDDTGREIFTHTSGSNARRAIANALFLDDTTLLIQENDRLFLAGPDGTVTPFYTLGDMQEGYQYYYNLYTLLMGRPIDKIITEVNDDYTNMNLLVSADGKKVLVSGTDGTTGVIILNPDGSRRCLLDMMPGTLAEYFALSPNGKYAACQSMFGFAAAWDTDTGEMLFRLNTADDFTSDISRPAFSPDGSRLAFVTNRTVTVLSMPAGSVLFRAETDTASLFPSLTWSRAGDQAFLINHDLFCVDTAAGSMTKIAAAPGDIGFNNCVALNGSLLISESGGAVRACSLKELASVTWQDNFSEPLCAPYDPEKTPDPIWDTLPEGTHEVTETFKFMSGLTDIAPTLTYSTDGMRAALSWPDGAIEVFIRGDAKPAAVIDPFADPPTAIGMTETYLAASEKSGRLLIADLNTPETPRVKQTQSSYTRFCFNPDGDMMMALAADGLHIDVYSLRDQELLFTLTAPSPFEDMAFTADGTKAVGLTPDGAVVGETWKREEDLLARARLLAAADE